MNATLTLSYDDGQSLIVPLHEVLELGLGPDAVTQIAFNKKKDGKWIMIVNKHILLGHKLADEFLTARKGEP